jgi:probable rRNA maturation factor
MMKFEFQTAKVTLPASEAQMKRWLKAGINAGLTAPNAPKKTAKNNKQPSAVSATSAVRTDSNSQLTIRFVGTVEGQYLNHQFRKKNYATNILTFPYSQIPLCADLVLCMPVLRKEAREQGKTLLDHLAHLLIHGVLHARGMDHEKASEAAQMESIEIALLADLGIANPYEH